MRRAGTHLIPSVAGPSENFIVDATLLCAFAAALHRRAGLLVVDDARPVDDGAQLVLCREEPLCEAADFFGLEAFAGDGSTCLEEERVLHFCLMEESGGGIWEERCEVCEPSFNILFTLGCALRDSFAL